MIKAVIFDYDDTLVQTMKSAWKGIKETGKRFYNIQITDEQIKEYWGQAYKDMLSGVLRNVDTFENLNKHYETSRKDFPMKPYPDAIITINKLLEKYKICIVTASGKKLVIDDLTTLGFPVDKFLFIQTSEDTTVHKPDPKVFDPVLKILIDQRITKDEVVCVGDSIRDFQAARDANINFYGVTHGGQNSKKEFEKEGAKTIDKLSNLTILLK